MGGVLKIKFPARVILLLHFIALNSIVSRTPADTARSAETAQAMILTPPASDTPRVNGPGIFGVRPGSPFLYTIPATGRRPMEFSADGLPSGLQLDAATGRITGLLKEPGEHAVRLRAKNSLGSAEKKFRIVVGDKIALTPPMGWNSYNSWGAAVSQEKVLSSAHAMVDKGLRDHGWTYINVDDHWQGKRGEDLNIQPNSKFPDMKMLGDKIHALGLKFGLYSSPWLGTYEGHIGSSGDEADGTYDWIKAGDHDEFFHIGKDPKSWSEKPKSNWKCGRYSFVEKDAAQFAAWGVDYLKYDWFPIDVPRVEEMARALDHCGRDVVFSLSNTATYDLAADYARLANVWRTTGDIRDTWQRMTQIGFAQDRWAAYGGPGHWNDPDMLVVGRVGGWGYELHPTHLTPDEQYTHISLWCLLSAPLLIGCPIAEMDDFTLSLLTNDEVLEIDQDALGKPATQISNEGDKVIYAKTLEDGSIALGLFNRGTAETNIAVHWNPWGELTTISGKQLVRDLWRQKDLGIFDGKFETKVAPHGVVLVRLSPKIQ
jgi:alpha-galactosidase